jgi:hypothetical protein
MYDPISDNLETPMTLPHTTLFHEAKELSIEQSRED